MPIGEEGFMRLAAVVVVREVTDWDRLWGSMAAHCRVLCKDWPAVWGCAWSGRLRFAEEGLRV